MKRLAIVVFERVNDDTPELDWRPIRAALPSGSCPLAIADHDGFTTHCPQEFSLAQVVELAERISGYKAAA